LNTSPNIIRVVRSSRKRWAGHAACMGGMSIQDIGQKTGRDHLEDVSVKERKALKWILGK
jgi:hypothetical protein